MSTLAVIATSTLTGVIGAAAMYVPARLALRDARTYRDEADRTFGAAESLADEVERTRNLPWHYAAIEAAPEDKPVIGEVLHVEPHETGEHPVVEPESEHKPNCPDLFYCPTVGGVESGCHGGFDVCCSAPELHLPVTEEAFNAGVAALAEEVGLAQALSDQPEHDDDDAPADDTDRPGLYLVLLAIPVALWDRLREWWQSLWAARRERHMVGSGEQATDGDPFAELLAHVEDGDVEERQVEIEAWVQRTGRHGSDVHAVDTGYRGRRWEPGIEHTGVFPVVVPAQREAAE